MNKKLIIAEKPSLAMKVAAGIGKMNKEDGYFENADYIITFAFGHLLELKSIDEYLQREKTKWSLDELPFIPEKFEFILKKDSGVKKQYNIIKQLYSRDDVTSIINAGDPDREGSVIILNIIQKVKEQTGKEKPVERIWLTATTPEFVREALKNRKEEKAYGNLYEEGLTRTYVDWLLGINFTRFVTLKAGSFYPVGRVLNPIVKFIYDRDKSIEEFKKEIFYEIEVEIKKDNQLVKCKIKNVRFAASEKEKGIEQLSKLEKEDMVVESIETKSRKKAAPKLFSLDKLQNKMSKEFKYSSAETLEIVQKLYEQGFVTYPRTNTEYLATAEKHSVERVLNQLCEEESVPLVMKDSKSIFDDSKIEGHTALIITEKFPDVSNLNEKEKNVYQVIKNRFIANFLNAETIIQETNVIIRVRNEEIDLKGVSVLEEGFLKYEKVQNETFLPIFIKGEKLDGAMKLAEKITQPPSHITEAELNTFLKNPFKKHEIEENTKNDDEDYKAILSGCEIGTVATRAGIIENAQKYEYILKQKNAFRVTEKGKALIKILDKLDIDMEKTKTVEIGMLLKKIYHMQITADHVVKHVIDEIKEVMQLHRNDTIEGAAKVNKGIGPCPFCGDDVLKGKSNYYCSNYKKKNCQFKIWETIAGKKLTENQVKQLLEKGKTGTIKGFTSKTGKKFDASLERKQDGTVGFIFSKNKK